MDKIFLEKAIGKVVGITLTNGQFLRGVLKETNNENIVIESNNNIFAVELSSISFVKIKMGGFENGN